MNAALWIIAGCQVLRVALLYRSEHRTARLFAQVAQPLTDALEYLKPKPIIFPPVDRPGASPVGDVIGVRGKL